MKLSLLIEGPCSDFQHLANPRESSHLLDKIIKKETNSNQNIDFKSIFVVLKWVNLWVKY